MPINQPLKDILWDFILNKIKSPEQNQCKKDAINLILPSNKAHSKLDNIIWY